MSMPRSRIGRAFMMAGALAALAISAAPAYAVEKGLCLPNQEMVTRLRSEGQRAVFNGDAILVEGVSTNPTLSVIYTSNSDGSVGYAITGQRNSDAAPPATLCVREALTFLRLANPTLRNVPTSFYAPNGMSRDEAMIVGQRRGIESAGSLNATMDYAAQSDLGTPVLQADIIGQDEGWTTVTVILTKGRAATVHHSGERGLDTMLYAMNHADLTAYAREQMGERSIWGGGRR